VRPRVERPRPHLDRRPAGPGLSPRRVERVARAPTRAVDRRPRVRRGGGRRGRGRRALGARGRRHGARQGERDETPDRRLARARRGAAARTRPPGPEPVFSAAGSRIAKRRRARYASALLTKSAGSRLSRLTGNASTEAMEWNCAARRRLPAPLLRRESMHRRLWLFAGAAIAGCMLVAAPG